MFLHSTRSPDRGPVPDRSLSATTRGAGRFGLHFLEMCAVMCLGAGLLIALFFGAAAMLGFADLSLEAPALSAFVAAALLAGVMVGWMRFRQMAWRPTLEMAGSSLVAGALLITGHWLGIVSTEALVPSVCGLACVAMMAVMLFRVPLYSSSHSQHSG